MTYRSVCPGAGTRAGEGDVERVEENDGRNGKADPEERQQGPDQAARAEALDQHMQYYIEVYAPMIVSPPEQMSRISSV